MGRAAPRHSEALSRQPTSQRGAALQRRAALAGSVLKPLQAGLYTDSRFRSSAKKCSPRWECNYQRHARAPPADGSSCGNAALEIQNAQRVHECAWRECIWTAPIPPQQRRERRVSGCLSLSVCFSSDSLQLGSIPCAAWFNLSPADRVARGPPRFRQSRIQACAACRNTIATPMSPSSLANRGVSARPGGRRVAGPCRSQNKWPGVALACQSVLCFWCLRFPGSP